MKQPTVENVVMYRMEWYGPGGERKQRIRKIRMKRIGKTLYAPVKTVMSKYQRDHLFDSEEAAILAEIEELKEDEKREHIYKRDYDGELRLLNRLLSEARTARSCT